MEARNFISISNSKNGDQIIKIKQEGEFAIRFLSSLIFPFVESYWTTVTFLSNMT